MIINFYDDDQPALVIDDERGKAIQQALANDTEWIMIDGNMYAAKSIRSIVNTRASINDVTMIGGVAKKSNKLNELLKHQGPRRLGS